jgi:hypothetical protein
MGLYETRGKMKDEFYFLMKRTLNLFLLKNNMSVSLCPRRFSISHSPILPYLCVMVDYLTVEDKFWTAAVKYCPLRLIIVCYSKFLSFPV